jgi:hypothetical protein
MDVDDIIVEDHINLLIDLTCDNHSLFAWKAMMHNIYWLTCLTCMIDLTDWPDWQFTDLPDFQQPLLWRKDLVIV